MDFKLRADSYSISINIVPDNICYIIWFLGEFKYEDRNSERQVTTLES